MLTVATGPAVQAAQFKISDNGDHPNGTFAKPPWDAVNTAGFSYVSGLMSGVVSAGVTDPEIWAKPPTTAVWFQCTLPSTQTFHNGHLLHLHISGDINTGNDELFVEYQLGAAGFGQAFIGYQTGGVQNIADTLAAPGAGFAGTVGIGYPGHGTIMYAYCGRYTNTLQVVDLTPYNPSAHISNANVKVGVSFNGSNGDTLNLTAVRTNTWNGEPDVPSPF